MRDLERSLQKEREKKRRPLDPHLWNRLSSQAPPHRKSHQKEKEIPRVVSLPLAKVESSPLKENLPKALSKPPSLPPPQIPLGEPTLSKLKEDLPDVSPWPLHLPCQDVLYLANPSFPSLKMEVENLPEENPKKPVEVESLPLREISFGGLKDGLPGGSELVDAETEKPPEESPWGAGEAIGSRRLILALPDDAFQGTELLSLAFHLARMWPRIFFEEDPDVVGVSEVKTERLHADLARIVVFYPMKEEKVSLGEMEKWMTGKPKVLILPESLFKLWEGLLRRECFVVELKEKAVLNYVYAQLINHGEEFLIPLPIGRGGKELRNLLEGVRFSLGGSSKPAPKTLMIPSEKDLFRVASQVGVFVEPQREGEEVVDKEQFPWKCAVVASLIQNLIQRESGKPLNPGEVAKVMLEEKKISVEENLGEDSKKVIIDVWAKIGESEIPIEVETFFGTAYPILKVVRDIEKVDGVGLRKLWVVIPPLQWALLAPIFKRSRPWLKALVEGLNNLKEVKLLVLQKEGRKWEMEELMKLP